MKGFSTALLIASAITLGEAQLPNDVPPIKNESLRQELLAMEKADQAARAAMLAELGRKGISIHSGKPITDPAALQVIATESAKLSKLDEAHRTRLKAIVKEFGWPGKSLVGADGAHAAWLLLQHADADRAFQTDCLRLMEAAPAGEVEGKHIAYLTDRVLIGAGKPQKYGTQLGADFKPLPILDKGEVDARRAKLGLPPLAEYIKTAKAEYEKLSQSMHENK
jgi:hypothetical protein